MRALRDFNTPKIPADDYPIFRRLIGDLFPGLDPPTQTNATLHQLILDVCAKEGLQVRNPRPEPESRIPNPITRIPNP